MKICNKDFFNKIDQIRRKLWIWSHLLIKSLIENFIFMHCNCLSKLSDNWSSSLFKSDQIFGYVSEIIFFFSCHISITILSLLHLNIQIWPSLKRHMIFWKDQFRKSTYKCLISISLGITFPFLSFLTFTGFYTLIPPASSLLIFDFVLSFLLMTLV